MAQITITISDEAANAIAALHDVSAQKYIQAMVDGEIPQWVLLYNKRVRNQKMDKYDSLSQEDKDKVDAILNA
jgi:hypothetical protein